MPSGRKPSTRCPTRPRGRCIARWASSSSSNQTAAAASAALCHVCRLESPSSNSPMRLAASSARPLTARSPASSSTPASRSRKAAGEVVGQPDRLEVGRGEEPRRARGRCRGWDSRDSARRIRAAVSAAQREQRLVPRRAPDAWPPRRSVPPARGAGARPSAGRAAPRERPAAARAAMAGRDSRGRRSSGAVPGTDAAVGGEHPLERGDRRAAARRPPGAGRAAGPAARTGRARRRSLPAGRRVPRWSARLHSGRRPARSAAPAPRPRCAAAMPAPTIAPHRKNIEPPAPAPAALPPSAPASRIAGSSAAISAVHIPRSSRCWQAQLAREQPADAAEIAGRSASAIRSARAVSSSRAPADRGIARARRQPSPGRWCRPRPGSARCSRSRCAAPARRRSGVERERLDAATSSPRKVKPMETAQRRGILVLAPAGDPRLDRFELPSQARPAPRGSRASPRAAASTATSATSSAPNCPDRTRRYLGAGAQSAGSGREHPQRGLVELEAAIGHQIGGRVHPCRPVQILRAKQESGAARLELGLDPEVDRRVDHHAALAGREWRHVGPAAGEIEPHRRARRGSLDAPARSPSRVLRGDPAGRLRPGDSPPAAPARDRERPPATSRGRTAAAPGPVGGGRPESAASGSR